jgi:hypothetical protein
MKVRLQHENHTQQPGDKSQEQVPVEEQKQIGFCEENSEN